MEAGASSMLFGALYGSLFGREDILPSLWMRPMQDLPTFMALATVLGVVLISVGLVLNIVNAWRAGERARALSSGLGTAFLYWVTLALLARAYFRWRLPTWLLLALAAVPVALLLLRPLLVRVLGGGRQRVTEGPVWLRALEGSIELVDTVFTFFANTFSFVRVAAFAAVHAGVMVALLAVVDTLSSLRFGGVWAALGLVAGNVLVIFLEGLTVSVQILRLEYYEFFNRFFRGGGEPYRPLMLQERSHHEPKNVGAAGGDGAAAAGRVGVGGG
jgi:V/A-type H+-transporting ATPase subunit I